MPDDWKVVEDSSKWRPLPPEIEAKGGPTPTASEIMPPATPTIKGERTPQTEHERAGANIIRYGVPVGVGLVTGGAPFLSQLFAGGMSTALSEITARQLERASTDPDLDTMWNDAKAAGTAGGIDVGVSLLSHGMGKAITSLAGKFLLPRNLPPDVELAQTVLGRMKEGAANLTRKWWQFKGKNDPFSLTLGQLNNEERGFVTWLEGIARGGTGKGIMSRFDARNVENVSEALTKYFEARTAQMTGPEFGVFMNRVLGTVDNAGEAFKPVEAFKAFLYKRFDDALETVADATIDGSALRKFIIDSSDPDLIKVYGQLRATSLLPELHGIESKTIRKTSTTISKTAEKRGTDIVDKTKKNLLKPESEPKRTFTSTESTAQGFGETTTQTTRIHEILADIRKTKEEVDQAWKNLPVQDAEKSLRLINSFYSNTDEAFNKRIKHMRKFLSDPFDRFVESRPELRDTLMAAKSYFGAKENALYNSTITALRRTIEKKPSGVASLLDITKGNPAVKYDTLMKVKRGLYFSAATPSAEAIREPVEKLWEDSVLKPLRFRVMDAASDQFGRLDPNKFMRSIEKVEKEAPEALSELWGSPAQVQHIKELASTYQTLLNTVPEKSIFIQLKTAAAVGTVGAAAGAGFSYVSGDNPTTGAAIGGALTILISPIVLAKALSNPTLTRALTDGLSDSTRAGGITPTLAMTFRKMAEMKAASMTFREAPSQDVMMFYNFAPQEEPEQPAANPPTPWESPHYD